MYYIISNMETIYIYKRYHKNDSESKLSHFPLLTGINHYDI